MPVGAAESRTRSRTIADRATPGDLGVVTALSGSDYHLDRDWDQQEPGQLVRVAGSSRCGATEAEQPAHGGWRPARAEKAGRADSRANSVSRSPLLARSVASTDIEFPCWYGRREAMPGACSSGREPTVYDHHPHLIRLLVQEQYADLHRNVGVAEALRTVRRARHVARRRRTRELVARFARIRSRARMLSLDDPLARTPSDMYAEHVRSTPAASSTSSTAGSSTDLQQRSPPQHSPDEHHEGGLHPAARTGSGGLEAVAVP